LIKKGIIIFFYVDDIIIAYSKASKFKADQAIEHLQGKYTITGGHNLQWFLGIEITRDQDQRKIFLSQTSYIDKIS
jgi:hypothetical protein